MTNLEELLNKLIEKGRKPRGSEIERLEIDEDGFISYGTDPLGNYGGCPFGVSMNDLCSLESELRQFVVEKGLIKFSSWKHNVAFQSIDDNMFEDWEICIMLSSIQENKEDFILSNIKLDD